MTAVEQVFTSGNIARGTTMDIEYDGEFHKSEKRELKQPLTFLCLIDTRVIPLISSLTLDDQQHETYVISTKQDLDIVTARPYDKCNI
jgi:hypothetical protein